MAVRAERYRRGLVHRQFGHLLACYQVPDFNTAATPCAAGCPLAIGAECNGLDLGMRAQHKMVGRIVHFKDLNTAGVTIGYSNPSAVRRDGGIKKRSSGQALGWTQADCRMVRMRHGPIGQSRVPARYQSLAIRGEES